jgi:hypothetical protein
MTVSSRLPATAQLLVEAFGQDAPTDVRYLDWLYIQNPAGTVVDANLDDELGCIGHYSVVPKIIAQGGESWRVGLSLNTAVAARARGGGLFTKLAFEVIDKSRAEDLSGILGVANANSTPGFVRRLGFTVEKSLPVKVGVANPAASRNLASGEEALAAIAVIEAARRTADPYTAAPVWTEELLRWRFARPGAAYFAYADADGGVFGAKTRQAGMPFACLMGLFVARPGACLGRLVSAACAASGTPLYVYGGWNRDVAVAGLPVPMGLRPSPLNLIWRDLTDARARPTPSRFRRFEFIDFDAY